MSTTTTEAGRLTLKTPEASFLHVLQNEFNYSYREAREVLTVARELLGLDQASSSVRPGQIRLVVASLKAPFGPPLSQTDRVEVTLTIDAGAEDLEVQAQQGREALRRGRIVRLMDEALMQGGVLTEEDLSRALQVSRRTIERDMRELRQAGHLIQTRGQLKGVGRGQTHKVKIIELWLNRDSYDRIARWVHHSPQAIKRYINTFLRVVTLQRQGRAVSEIAFLVGASEKLVRDYLAVAKQAQERPEQAAKLEEELARVQGLTSAAKKGGL
jgi:DNA-binding transcriptional ArsR family regulator